MKLKELIDIIDGLFLTNKKDIYKKESGVTVSTTRDIKRIGYCVSLTYEAVKEAINNNIDLIITHHPAWDFMPKMKKACEEALKNNNIGHYYNHLPLDDAPFGTNATLAMALGFDEIHDAFEYGGLSCGRYGIYHEAIDFKCLVKRMERILKEPVRIWSFHDRKIKKVGIVCGGGEGVSLIEKADHHQCDVYITGEKNLYTLQYGQFLKMNLIIGSHTFIEWPGINGLAKEVKKKCQGLEILPLREVHME